MRPRAGPLLISLALILVAGEAPSELQVLTLRLGQRELELAQFPPVGLAFGFQPGRKTARQRTCWGARPLPARLRGGGVCFEAVRYRRHP